MVSSLEPGEGVHSCIVYASSGLSAVASHDDYGPVGYRFELWRPSLLRVRPREDRRPVLIAWWAFHHLRIFANREYAQLLIYHGAALVHRSAIFPRYARFPFMGPRDIQIGDTWTRPDQRGRGLAGSAIRWIVDQLSQPDRTIWYVAEAENLASIRAAERGGLRPVGECIRTKRLGLRLLGAFILTGAPRGALDSTLSHVSDR